MGRLPEGAGGPTTPLSAARTGTGSATATALPTTALAPLAGRFARRVSVT